MQKSSLAALVLLVSVGLFLQSAPAQAPPATPANSVAGLFVDVMARSGVSFQGVASHTPQKYLLETMGSGVALFDFDNDGLLDIFFVNGAPPREPKHAKHDSQESERSGLESSLSPEKGRHIYRRDRSRRPGGHRLWDGRGGWGL
jgi:hypothetical protein